MPTSCLLLIFLRICDSIADWALSKLTSRIKNHKRPFSDLQHVDADTDQLAAYLDQKLFVSMWTPPSSGGAGSTSGTFASTASLVSNGRTNAWTGIVEMMLVAVLHLGDPQLILKMHTVSQDSASLYTHMSSYYTHPSALATAHCSNSSSKCVPTNVSLFSGV